MNGWRRAVLPLLTVTVLSVGCGGLPAADRPSRLPSDIAAVPTASASASSSASPSPSTTPARSASPALATEAEQVEAAVRHYFDVVNQALATGDTKPLAALSVPKCGCRELVRYIDGEYRRGHTEGSSFTVLSVRDVELHVRLAALTVTFDVEAGRTVSRTGEVLTTSRAGQGIDRMDFVEEADGRWLVSAVTAGKRQFR